MSLNLRYDKEKHVDYLAYLNTPDEVRQAPGHVEAGNKLARQTKYYDCSATFRATTTFNIYIPIIEEVHSTE